MKKNYIFIMALLCLSLSGCNTGDKSEGSTEKLIESVTETEVKTEATETEIETETIKETTIASDEKEEIPKNSIDISDIVLKIREYYDDYKDIALKHGMIYTDGTKTDGPIMMEEITPYEPGDTLADYVLVSEEPRHNIIELEVVDYDELYDLVKDFDELALLTFIDRDRLDYSIDEEGLDFSDMSDLEALRILERRAIEECGNISVDDWINLSIEEQRDLTVKMAIKWRTDYNDSAEELNEETRRENEELAKIKTKVPANVDVKEYKRWYNSNKTLFVMISNIDFTVGKVLPDYITEDGNNYYITEENLKDLWKSQGSPENKNIEIECYGYSFIFDVSLLYQDW